MLGQIAQKALHNLAKERVVHPENEVAGRKFEFAHVTAGQHDIGFLATLGLE